MKENLYDFYELKIKKPSYEDYVTSSTYVKMRDRIQIALDIHLPKEVKKDKKLPTILIQTRYCLLRSGLFLWSNSLLFLDLTMCSCEGWSLHSL